MTDPTICHCCGKRPVHGPVKSNHGQIIELTKLCLVCYRKNGSSIVRSGNGWKTGAKGAH